MATTNDTISRQWASRMPEERFCSLHEAGAKLSYLRSKSAGMTAFARGIAFQDDRVLIERQAGEVLKLAMVA